jgi:assimilatory nitrate reductase catalytic subunit
MPPLVRQLTAARANGGRLIVVDPRLTPTARLADLHLQPMPGSDLALAHGLLHLLIGEGYVDEAYVAERTTGFEELRHLVAAYWPEQVERLTGVPVGRLREAARILGEADTAMVLTARGAEQHAKGVYTALSFINIALALGQVGKQGGGFGTITGKGNGQGGREQGQKADQLPGYRRIDDPAARAHVAGVWGVDPDSLPGVGPSAYELLDSLGSRVRNLLVFGSNPVVSAPRAAHVAERLASLDFLVVADFVLSETAARADVVLPVTQWAEETGTMTNLEGRVIMRHQAVEPPEGVRSDLEVIAELAARLGRPTGFSTDPAVVFTELGRASAGGPADYSGMSHARIEAEGGLFWPCPAGDGETPHPGTPRLFTDTFPTPDGRARFHAVGDRGSAEAPDEEYPLYLTTGRVLAHYQSGAQTRLVRALREASPAPFVELHPALASRLGIADGDPVRLTTRRGEAFAPARVTTSIRPDTVFMPFHWAGPGRVNTLTNPALDPVSRMPEFKVCAVRVEAVASAFGAPSPNATIGRGIAS